MLIVIVIIGILAAALIPRLSSARGRANDVARKADLAQTAAALVSYQIDHGRFPTCPETPTEWCTLNDIADDLTSAGMSSIPFDPNSTREIYPGIDGVTASSTTGEYAYITISKWWISNNWFVIMAATETEWWSNRVAATTNNIGSENITGWSAYDAISSAICREFWTAPCTYNTNNDELRYIYIY